MTNKPFVVSPFNSIQTYHYYLTKNECDWWLITVVVCFLLSLYAAIKTRQCFKMLTNFNYSAFWFDAAIEIVNSVHIMHSVTKYHSPRNIKFVIRNSKYLCILHLSLQFNWFENNKKRNVHREFQKCLCGM